MTAPGVPNLVSVTCPSCGASLPPRAPCGNYTCDYCGSKFEARQARAASTVHGVKIDVAQLAQAIAAAQAAAQAIQRGQEFSSGPVVTTTGVTTGTAGRKRKGAALGFALFMVFIAGILPVLITLMVTSKLKESFERFSVPFAKGDGAGSAAARLTVFSRTLPALLRTAGVSSLVARVDRGASPQICRFDLADGRERWCVGELGDPARAQLDLGFAVAGERVVVTDLDQRVRVIDGKTGKEQHRYELPEKPEAVCGYDERRVLVRLADETGQLVETSSGQAFVIPASKRDAKATTSPEQQALERCGRGDPTQGSARQMSKYSSRGGRPDGPALEGYEVIRVLHQGGDRLAFARKRPGTPIPRLVAFEPGSDTQRWAIDALASSTASFNGSSDTFAALGDGRVAVVHGSGSDTWHLTVYRAADGGQLWTKVLRPIFAVDWVFSLTVEGDRVAVQRMKSIELYDAQTGAEVAVIGEENYDERR